MPVSFRISTTWCAARIRHVVRGVGRAIPSAALVLGATAACSPSALVDVHSPSTVVDPSQVENASGAVAFRVNAINGMMAAFGQGPGSVVTMSGAITDELLDRFQQTGDNRNVLDATIARNMSGYGYDQIQSARVQVRQARQALQAYAVGAPAAIAPRAWQGELYALEGYTIVWLAELYCSGIPLSESSLKGAQVPTRGLTTQELLAQAIVLFDSAVTAGADSAQYVNLARVGKARALLALGQFAAADSAVADVPTNFVYLIPSSSSGGAVFDFPVYGEINGAYETQDREGGNGLVWSTDPRTVVVPIPDQTGAMLWPAKYNLDPSTGVPDPLTPRIGESLRLADGLEARLIQAEAALYAGNASWLTTLNMLRATCVGSAACAPIPGLTAAQLPPLTDPGTPSLQLDTLMKERAMWLYLTGHREGDLRRLAHVYNRDPDTLWPTGVISEPAYPTLLPNAGNENGQLYGSDVLYGPDVNEHLRNPLYTGCNDTNP